MNSLCVNSFWAKRSKAYSGANGQVEILRLNKYMVSFFQTYFSGLVDLSGIETLLSEPENADRSLFSTRDNQIACKNKLMVHGFIDQSLKYCILCFKSLLIVANFTSDALDASQDMAEAV
jgi:hypothetical protein